MDFYKISGPKSLGIEYVNDLVIIRIKADSINTYELLMADVELIYRLQILFKYRRVL